MFAGVVLPDCDAKLMLFLHNARAERIFFSRKVHFLCGAAFQACLARGRVGGGTFGFSVSENADC